jgi:hypothetical protein
MHVLQTMFVTLTCATDLVLVRPTLLDRVRRSENRWFSKTAEKKGLVLMAELERTGFSADAALQKYTD